MLRIPSGRMRGFSDGIVLPGVAHVHSLWEGVSNSRVWWDQGVVAGAAGIGGAAVLVSFMVRT